MTRPGKEFVMLAGPPGSGKSTHAAALVAIGFVCLTGDQSGNRYPSIRAGLFAQVAQTARSVQVRARRR